MDDSKDGAFGDAFPVGKRTVCVCNYSSDDFLHTKQWRAWADELRATGVNVVFLRGKKATNNSPPVRDASGVWVAGINTTLHGPFEKRFNDRCLRLMMLLSVVDAHVGADRSVSVLCVSRRFKPTMDGGKFTEMYDADTSYIAFNVVPGGGTTNINGVMRGYVYSGTDETTKKVFENAACTLYNGMVLSRKLVSWLHRHWLDVETLELFTKGLIAHTYYIPTLLWVRKALAISDDFRSMKFPPRVVAHDVFHEFRNTVCWPVRAINAAETGEVASKPVNISDPVVKRTRGIPSHLGHSACSSTITSFIEHSDDEIANSCRSLGVPFYEYVM